MDKKINSTYKIKTIIAFFAIYFIWGSAFSIVAVALKTFPPLVLSAFRFLIGGLLLTAYCIYKKEAFPGVKKLTEYIITGIIVFIGGVVAVAWAQQYITSGMASIIITTPFWFMVLDRRNWKTNFSSPFTISGMMLCLLGVIVLLLNRQSHQAANSDHPSAVAILVIVAGSFLWVAGSLYLKYKSDNSSIVVRTSVQLLAAATFCTIICLLNGSFLKVEWSNVNSKAIASLLYLSIVSTTITFMAFIWLMQHKTPALVSTYAYINPIVAVLLGSVLLHEEILWIQIASMLVILSGVFLINLPNYKTIKS